MGNRDFVIAGDELPDVSMVAWNISPSCNLRCAHCYLPDEALAGKGLTREELLSVVDNIVDVGAKALFLAGGEPLLHADLFEVISHAASSGLRVFINTNGVLLTEALGKKLVRTGLSGVIIGIDGLTADFHDRIRGRGTYNKALAAFKTVVSTGLAAEIDFTLSRFNRQQLKDLPFWGDAIGANRITVKRYVPRLKTEADDLLRLSASTLQEAYNGLLDVEPYPSQRKGCKVFAHDPLFLVAKAERGILEPSDILREDCNAAGWRRGWLGVNAQGQVSPCPVMNEISVSPERGVSWRKLTQSDLFTKVREAVPSMCLGCHHAPYCRGACRATKLRMGIGLDEPDPCCWIAAEIPQHSIIKG